MATRLFLPSPDIVSLTAEIPEFTDDYTDVGARVTHGAVTDDYTDVGARVTHGAVTDDYTDVGARVTHGAVTALPS
jgi:hypothetical protein